MTEERKAGRLFQRVRRLAPGRSSATTVVVSVGPRQARFLPDCLLSLPADAEVLVAPWGDHGLPADVPALEASATGNDARNAGAEAARSDHVLFLDATETLVEGALSALRDGVSADHAVTAGRGGAHELSRLLWRREAVPRFDPAHGRFPQAALPEMVHPVPSVVSAHQDRLWAVPFGTVAPTAGEICHLARLLSDCGDARWLPDFLTAHAPAFLDDFEHAVDKDVQALAHALGRLTSQQLSVLPVETRLRLWLVAHGHHREMSRFSVDRWFTTGQFPTVVENGEVRALLPVDGVDVPREVMLVDSELEASLRRVVLEGDVVRVNLFAAIRWVDLGRHAPVFTAAMIHADGSRVPVEVTVEPDAAATRYFRQLHQSHDAGALSLKIDAAALTADGPWRLAVSLDVAGIHVEGPVTDRDARGSAGVLEKLPVPGGCLRFDRTHGLEVVIGRPPSPSTVDTTLPQVLAVEIGDELVVHGTCRGAIRLEMRRGDLAVAAHVTVGTDGEFIARVPLVHDPWGLGEQPLPTGTWHFPWTSGRRSGELQVATALAERTPVDEETGVYRTRVMRGLRNQLLVSLQAPLGDDELGPRAQEQLRQSYAVSSAPLDEELVLFNVYAGTGVTDSPRAVFDELRARRADLRCVWVVADHSVVPPPGAERVLLRSREWYDALATAGHIVTNVEMDRFFATRPGQVLVQTFHGYPSKAMGLGLWRSKNYSPLRLALQLEHTSATWSVLLTPAPEMDRHYREQYAYDGTILNRGLPRADALVDASAEETRAEVRRRLGIADGQTAVLYAPTWRDDQATNYRAAPLVTHLDLSRASAALGNGYTILLRGHRFQRAPRDDHAAHVLDVSTYPEINDLILAADVAVLDYSSIRFDFALTRKPMVFLVPDLEEYAGSSRGFLYPFTDSAPGPLLSTTDEVVEALRDVPMLAGAHAAAMVRFNAVYNAYQDGHATERVVDRVFAGRGATG